MYRFAGRLNPEAIRFVVVKEERFLVEPTAMAEIEHFVPYAADIHDARVAKRSVGDEHRDSTDLIDHHFMIV